MGASPYRENAAVAPVAGHFTAARALGAAFVVVLAASVIVFVLRARPERGEGGEGRLTLADPGDRVPGVSKGSAASTPPSSLSLAHAEQALDSVALPAPPSTEDVVRMNVPTLQYECGERAAGQRKKSARVTVDVVVGPSGAVESALASGGGPALNECLERGIAGWRFPRVGLRTKVEVPFLFRAGEGSGNDGVKGSGASGAKDAPPRRCLCLDGDPLCSCLN